jgi:hypothetical protein
LIDEIIQKHKAAAGPARTVLDESTSLESRIRSAIERLDHKVSETTVTVQILDDNLTGAWCDFFVFDTPGFKDLLLKSNNEIDTHCHFLQKSKAIREELERQLIEVEKQIKGAEAIEEQLIKLYSYRDQKNLLLEAYSDGKFFELADLERAISAFEPELFEKDFIPFFNKLKTRNHGESRLLAIPVPDTGDANFEKFWRFWRYEFLRNDLLSRPWKDDDSRDYHTIAEMRTIAHAVERYGPLVKDFVDLFLPELQKKNPMHKILDLR